MDYNFRFFLNFLGLPLIGRIEVSEFFGFDGSSHKLKQEDGRFGRDIVIGNEEIELTITRGHFELMDNYQMGVDGVAYNYATQGFDFVASEIKNKGWECEIEVIISKDGVDFNTGIIDGYTADVKQDKITFKVIQNTKREEIKRRSDIYIDAFNDEDLDGNAIDPCQTRNIFLEPKPIKQVSEWFTPLPFDTGLRVAPTFVNGAFGVRQYGIEDTLSFLTGNEFFSLTFEDFKFIFAQNVMTDVKIRITNNDSGLYVGGGGDITQLRYSIGFDIGSTVTTVVDTRVGVSTFDEEYEIDIPYIEKGMYLWLYYSQPATSSFITNSMDVNIEVTSVSIGSVIKGVRLIDLMKHNVKSVGGGIPLIAPDYDLVGEHYDNFAFNGYLLSQDETKPFNNRFKDIIDISLETCSDFQVNPDNVELLPYSGFYINIEMGVFSELADSENNTSFNKRFFLKEFWLGYNNSSDERQNNGKNTIDDVHTDSQWMYPSKKTDGALKININHVRSAYLIEEQRRKATVISEKTTSLQNDEKLFLLDCVALAPGTLKSFTTKFECRVDDNGNLQLLSDGSFNWELLGFNLGDTISLTHDGTTIDYTAFVLTPNLITLEPVTAGTADAFDGVFTVTYPLTNVQYINRTDEGFDFIDGVISPDNYSNLNYSLKRNIQRWFPYLATAGKFLIGKVIKNTLFKVNGELVTRKTGELTNVIDKASIDIDAIADLKILTPKIHKVSVFCDFTTATQLFLDARDDKGFVRVLLNTNEVVKGYPKELDYEWATQKLTFNLEEKFESDYLTIVSLLDGTVINEVFYSGVSFTINNNFVSLYDSDDIRIINPTSFEYIKIDDVSFTDVDLFSETLISILTL